MNTLKSTNVPGSAPSGGDSAFGRAASSRRLPLFLAAAVVVAIAAPALVVLGRLAVAPLPDVVVDEDSAVLELYTLRATQGEQVLGPYSRFRFHHPGPALFYLLAPFYELGGHRHGALNVGMLVGSLVWLAVVMAVAWRTGGAFGLVLAGPFLAVLVLHLRPALLWTPWNPFAAILPFAAGAACAFAVAIGRWGFLPVGLFAGSLAVQCHLGMVMPTALVWGAALGVAIPAAVRARRGPSKPTLAAAAVVLALLWVPVGVEELRGEPGNLTKIARHVASRSDPLDFGRAVTKAAPAISEAFLAPFGYGGWRPLGAAATAASAAVTVVIAVLAGVALHRQRERRPVDVRAAAACLGALFVAAPLAVLSLTGDWHDYLIRWVAVIGPLTGVLVACILAPAIAAAGSRRRATILGVALAATLGCGTASVVEAATGPPLAALLDAGSGRLGPSWSAVAAALDARGMTAPQVRILDIRGWRLAAAIVLQLEKSGREVSIQQRWGFMLGEHLVDRPDDGLILVTTRQRARDLAAFPGADRVAGAGPIALVPAGKPVVAEGERSCLRADGARFARLSRGGFGGVREPADGPAFRRSSGRLSELSVPLEPGRGYSATLDVAPAADRPVTVDVALNGRPVAELLLRPGWASYPLTLEPADVGARNRLTLVYRTDGRVEGGGRHAILFRALCFEPSRKSETDDAAP